MADQAEIIPLEWVENERMNKKNETVEKQTGTGIIEGVRAM